MVHDPQNFSENCPQLLNIYHSCLQIKSFFYIKSLRGLIPPIRRLCQLVTTFGRRQLRWGLFPRDGSVERPRVWEQVLRVFRHTHMQWTDSSNRIYAATGLHSLSVSNTLQYS